METELTNLTENEKETISIFKSMIENVTKFRNKNTAVAAARARKDASQLSKLLKVVRKEIQEAKLALKEQRSQG